MSLQQSSEGTVSALTVAEGGLAQGLPAVWRGQVVIGRREVAAVVRLAEGRKRLAPGESGVVTVTTERAEGIERGFTLGLQESGQIIAIGAITR
jgi:translation elongation factor EF-Tu-like GTPase